MNIYSTMVLFYCIFTLSIYNCCHTLSNSSGLVKRIHLMCKAGSIQIESYSLLPKVYRKFMTNFSSKRKPQFQVCFGQDSFPMNTSPFQASHSQNSANCLLTNEWWNACFYHYYFYRNVSHLFFLELGLASKIILFCRTDNFGRLP